MTQNQKEVINLFYKDIIDNFRGKGQIVEYFYNRELDYFTNYFESDIDRVGFFGKELIITKPMLFYRELKKMLLKDFNVRDFDIQYDSKGNVCNIFLDLQKRN